MFYPAIDALWSSSVNCNCDILLISIDQISSPVLICMINVVYVPQTEEMMLVVNCKDLTDLENICILDCAAASWAEAGLRSHLLLPASDLSGSSLPGAESVIGSNRSRLMTSSFLATTD